MELTQEQVQLFIDKIEYYEQLVNDLKGQKSGLNAYDLKNLKALYESMKMLRAASVIEIIKKSYNNNNQVEQYIKDKEELLIPKIERLRNSNMTSSIEKMLNKCEKELAEARDLRNNPQNFVSYIIGKQQQYGSMDDIIKNVLDFDHDYGDYLSSNTFNHYEDNDKKFAYETSNGMVVNTSNVLLAKEVLSGNSSNFDKLVEIYNIEHKTRKSPETTAKEIKDNINKLKKCERELSYCNEQISNINKQYQSYGILKIFHKDLLKDIDILRSTRRRLLEDKTEYNNTIDRSLDSLSKKYGEPASLSNFDSFILSCKQKYDMNERALFDRKEELKKQVPSEMLNANPHCLDRINYYGRGRINEKEDYMFDVVRTGLDTLLMIDSIKKESNIKNTIFSPNDIEEIQNMSNENIQSYLYNQDKTDEVDKMIDDMINGKLDVEGQPISQNNDMNNSNTRTMGFGGMWLIGLITGIMSCGIILLGVFLR